MGDAERVYLPGGNLRSHPVKEAGELTSLDRQVSFSNDWAEMRRTDQR